MRIWSVHPSYLDAKGLVACWRETLLAQKVLDGRTSGYRNHPQLERFRAQPDPLAAIGAYLEGLLAEADARGYDFDGSRILKPGGAPRIGVTTGQLDHEFRHLREKLAARSPGTLGSGPWAAGGAEAHPLFTVAEGPVADWERT
ncbi:pyrimidine dimer DNA glycosylase/endonuclease V [Corynebacterium sp. 335C]